MLTTFRSVECRNTLRWFISSRNYLCIKARLLSLHLFPLSFNPTLTSSLVHTLGANKLQVANQLAHMTKESEAVKYTHGQQDA